MDDLNISIDEEYFPRDFLDKLKLEGAFVNKLLNSYIAYLRRRKEKDQWVRQLINLINKVDQINWLTKLTQLINLTNSTSV